MNLNNFGSKLKFKQRSSNKSKTISEKELFVETVDMLFDLWKRSNETYEKYKINLLEYEEMFYQTIEGFILLKYGAWKTEIILWYIFIRMDDKGDIAPLIYQVKGKEDVEVILNNSTELWDLLKQIEENDLTNDK